MNMSKIDTSFGETNVIAVEKKYEKEIINTIGKIIKS